MGWPCILHADQTENGTIEFEGRDLLSLPESEMQRIRGKEIAYIPQDPTTTLDPVYSVGDQLTEVIMRHQPVTVYLTLSLAGLMMQKNIIYLTEIDQKMS